MNIKLVYLKTGEYIVTELLQVSEEKKLICFVFKNPKLILTNPEWGESNTELRVQVSLITWPQFTKTKDVEVFPDSVVSVVDPTDELSKLYEDSLNEHQTVDFS